MLNFARVLANTKPRKQNQKEWDDIRRTTDDIIGATKQDNFPEMMNAFVVLFKRIAPIRENTKEWAAIRGKCEQMSASKNALAQFYVIVEQFAVTSPIRENTQEWQKIRSVCKQILS